MSDSLNASTFAPLPSRRYKIPAFYGYIGVGSAALIANVVCFVILFSDRKLLKASALLFGLALSHCVCGLHLVWAGLFRLVNVDLLHFRDRHPWYCVGMIFPDLFPFAFQSLASLLMVAAVERLLAFAAPIWFHVQWGQQPGRAWIVTSCCYGFATISVVSAFCTAWIAVSPIPATLECVQTTVFAPEYVLYYESFSSIAGAISVVITLIAYRMGRRHIATLTLVGGESARMRRQFQLTKTFLSICVIDFLLVVIPNATLVVQDYFTTTFPWLFSNVIVSSVPSIATIGYGVNAVITIFANFFFNSEFRRAAVKLMRPESSTNVVPIGVQVQATPNM